MSNHENFNLETFVLHYNSIQLQLSTKILFKIHKSTKLFPLKNFRLYGRALYTVAYNSADNATAIRSHSLTQLISVLYPLDQILSSSQLDPLQTG